MIESYVRIRHMACASVKCGSSSTSTSTFYHFEDPHVCISAFYTWSDSTDNSTHRNNDRVVLKTWGTDSGDHVLFMLRLMRVRYLTIVISELTRSARNFLSSVHLINAEGIWNGCGVSEWVSSFLTAHQHILGYSVPFIDLVLLTV